MLKVGVFGVGHLGKFHLNNWKEIERMHSSLAFMILMMKMLLKWSRNMD